MSSDPPPLFARSRPPGSLRLWISLASLLCLAWALQGHVEELRTLRIDRSGWLQLAVAVMLTTVSVAVNGFAWWRLLAWLEQPLPFSFALPLFCSTNLFKYIPGGIWHFVGRLRSLSQRGWSLGAGLTGVLLDPLLIAVAGLLLVPLGGFQQGLGLLCPLAVLVLLPRWRDPLIERLARARSRQLKRPLARQRSAAGGGVALPWPSPSAAAAPADPVEETPTEAPTAVLLGRGMPWGPLLCQVGFVLARFLGFLACALVFLPAAAPQLIGPAGYGVLLAGFALAYTAGLVVPGAPGGLGVFELTLVVRLGGVVPQAPLLAIAFCYRLVSSLADLLAAAVAWPLSRGTD
ncbi:MAG: UPF0104 family protein [Aphanocapsa feldmannii 277cV]|uniref:UPF0104 family protein n=1 Tax=Aphanocapsa feldmannii 277cV TaxID=2507553 RepID=A0A524RN93_9CHRO|nr:MAG: UPF0104 family protein [Aphanocapsa feldmannii 288cV]TGG92234.1 MAG: UPF0104 family protein [Aphanocapsa feldmannii 277cV]